MFKPCTYRPSLRFLVTPDPNEGGGSSTGAGDQEPAEGQPGHVAVKDRTPEEQIAFHQAKARRIEETLKDFDGLTPAQVKEAIAENARLKQQHQTESEKAVDAAREEGRNEYRQILGRERVKSTLAAALKGRTYEPDALLEFDASKFVKGDAADGAAITAWVEGNTTPAPSGARSGPDLGQGRRGGTTTTKGVDAGRDLYDSQKKTSRKD